MTEKLFRLKPDQPEFEITEGMMRGNRYRHGRGYDSVPEQYRDRFELFSVTPVSEVPENDEPENDEADEPGWEAI